MKINKDMVGCRILYTLNEDMMNSLLSGEIEPREGMLREISPDGNYVKILQLNPEKEERWHLASDVDIISILERSEAEVKKEAYL